MCDAHVDYCYVRVPGSDWQMCGQSSGESSRRWYNNNNNINNIINGFSLCLFNSYARSRSNSVVAFPSSAAAGFHRVIRKPAWYKLWCKTTVNFGCDVILFHTCIGRSFFPLRIAGRSTQYASPATMMRSVIHSGCVPRTRTTLLTRPIHPENIIFGVRSFGTHTRTHTHTAQCT